MVASANISVHDAQLAFCHAVVSFKRGPTPTSTLGLFLALCPEVSPGNAWGPFVMPEIRPGSLMCQGQCLTPILSVPYPLYTVLLNKFHYKKNSKEKRAEDAKEGPEVRTQTTATSFTTVEGPELWPGLGWAQSQLTRVLPPTGAAPSGPD